MYMICLSTENNFDYGICFRRQLIRELSFFKEGGRLFVGGPEFEGGGQRGDQFFAGFQGTGKK